MSRPRFIWPAKLADRVLSVFHRWSREWSSGIPDLTSKYNPNPTDGEDSRTQSDPHYYRRKHKVGFTLNEITWLCDTLNAESPSHPMTIVFNRAKLNLEKALNSKRVADNTPWPQEYCVQIEDVRWTEMVLARIKFGHATPAQLEYDNKNKSEAIEKWAKS